MSDKPVFTLDQIADYLITSYPAATAGGQNGIKWVTSKDNPIPVDVSRMDATGKALVRKALDLWCPRPPDWASWRPASHPAVISAPSNAASFSRTASPAHSPIGSCRLDTKAG